MSSIERRRGRSGALVRQRFVNLNPPACLPCQGGNPCPRPTAEPGRGVGQKGYGKRRSGVGVASVRGTRRCSVACGPCGAACDMRHPVAFLRHPSHFAPPCARGGFFGRARAGLREWLPGRTSPSSAKAPGLTVEGPIGPGLSADPPRCTRQPAVAGTPHKRRLRVATPAAPSGPVVCWSKQATMAGRTRGLASRPRATNACLFLLMTPV